MKGKILQNFRDPKANFNKNNNVTMFQPKWGWKFPFRSIYVCICMCVVHKIISLHCTASNKAIKQEGHFSCNKCINTTFCQLDRFTTDPIRMSEPGPKWDLLLGIYVTGPVYRCLSIWATFSRSGFYFLERKLFLLSPFLCRERQVSHHVLSQSDYTKDGEKKL